MYLTYLDLHNYRGFQESKIEFDEKLNVFIGENGAGKSTVLDAVSLGLSWIIARMKSPNASGRTIDELDVKVGFNKAILEFEANLEHQATYETHITWRSVKNIKGISHDEKSKYVGLNRLTENRDERKQSLPVLVYYPVRRAVLDIPLRIRKKHTFDIFSVYDEALTSAANFRTFFEWFREREDFENQKIAERAKEPPLFNQNNSLLIENIKDDQLEAVRSALHSFVPEFTDLSVKRSPLRMIVKKNNHELQIDSLSDGEKCLIALIGDLARRLAIANPNSGNPLEGDGVILIDEIDLHLHPKWQRMIIPQLLKVFPNCQFIISTHSPHVVTHVKKDKVFILKEDKNTINWYKPGESYGRSVERILEDIMGLSTTRPDEIKKQLNDISEDIMNHKYDKARKKIDSLKMVIGDDPDLVRAKALIERKESIGI